MDFLTAEHIVKDYSGHRALNDVSISVPKAKIFGLLGPNGAGKTTLIRIINQILLADSGSIVLNGVRLNQAQLGTIGYLPEERGLYKKMKVGEQTVYLAQLKGLDQATAKRRAKEWFERFEIASWWNRNVEELSKGMQQKVQFIVTVIHQPQLLILDEPFSGFDPINANLIKNEILTLKEQGSTIILSTHNMSSVEELCDSIALIHKGNKVLDGEVDTVRREFATNTFEIKFSGWFDSMSSTLTPDYQIVTHEKVGNTTTVRIKLMTQLSTNDLLKHMMGLGSVQSFNEILPSMNDIFIDVVESQNAKG